jgi:hypothetical protein
VQTFDTRPFGQSSDCRDLLAATESRRENGAAIDGTAINQNSARAALGAIAAEVGAGHAEIAGHCLP